MDSPELSRLNHPPYAVTRDSQRRASVSHDTREIVSLVVKDEIMNTGRCISLDEGVPRDRMEFGMGWPIKIIKRDLSGRWKELLEHHLCKLDKRRLGPATLRASLLVCLA